MEKIEAQTSQMDVNLEASRDTWDTDLKKDLLEADLTVESLAENPKASAGSTENIPDEIAEGEIRNMDQGSIDTRSTESSAEVNLNGKRPRGTPLRHEIKIMNPVTGSSYFHLWESNQKGTDSMVTENECPAKDFELSVRKESSLSALSAEGGSFSTYYAERTSNVSFSRVNGAEYLSKDLGCYTRITPVHSVKRNLVVLDVNGLLAHIVMPAPQGYRADKHILGRAIFKRPFCDDFLKFCFQNFDVGVWSSRSKRIIERVVDYLLGDQKDKLLFCWDMSHSTQTGFNTLENVYKPLVFKELRKIWQNDDPSLPWKNGDYNESNTLLLDDSPYKALLNPVHTAIFPNSYHYKDSNDNSLGPGGDLRVYLEGLLQSENVQKYVEQHPIGQSSINESNLSWTFYSGVLQSMPKELQDTVPVPNLR
ncbi:hypothetical protein SASPL_142266 [Salvia splendens]|uniref:Mitochondrial import inner membrane translocase subunit TIM50 n=1 Tax=Salvia splendens TaxID=180675 RepID=A0A8X8WKA8_SALSN|nr:uncharacterized protein LOC121772198 [Salvia splendens]KAG6396125.1 hypothetical protein SASPL_142266 [Salvia splendens]